MSVESQGMMGAGVAALAAGLFLVRRRFSAAVGVGKILAGTALLAGLGGGDPA